LSKIWATYLNLPDTQVQKGHALPNLNDTLGTDTTHGCTETTVELEHSKFVEDGGVNGGENLVLSDVLRLGRLDFLPVTAISTWLDLWRGKDVLLHTCARTTKQRMKLYSQLLALCTLGQESVEEQEERLCFRVEDLSISGEIRANTLSKAKDEFDGLMEVTPGI
jgi:hypothetical protein